MKIIKQGLIIAMLAFTAHSAFATVESDCQGIYPNDERPSEVGTEKCFNKYAIVYSDQLKTSLISSEHLTADDINAAKLIKRSGHFFTDKELNSAKSSQYTHSGYQRGHLVPSADMPTIEAQHQTFDMSNITPETKQFNEVVWERVERNVRQQVLDNGEAYIINAPIFKYPLTKMNGIAIPTSVAKVVYFPKTGVCEAYVVTNTDVPYTQEMSVSEFNEKYFRDFFTEECK